LEKKIKLLQKNVDMKKCPTCHSKIGFFRKLLFNIDSDVWLSCKECGGELVDRSRFSLHLLYTGILLTIFFMSGSYITDYKALVYFIEFICVIFFFYLFLPIRKNK